MVTWLVFSGKAATRLEASALADDILNAGYFEEVSGGSGKFKDNNAFYRFIDSKLETGSSNQVISKDVTDQTDSLHDNAKEHQQSVKTFRTITFLDGSRSVVRICPY